VVVPALEQLYTLWGSKTAPFDTGFQHLWIRSAEYLLQRSEVPPQPPPDWRQEVKIDCACPDCRELQAFARDPVEKIHRFRVKKERRQHLHRAIDKHRMDMIHVTDRKGSPQTLVCTKNRRSFERRRQQYGGEIAAMRTLLGIASKSKAAMPLCGRMQAAIAASS
jgi:hypothetical protein